MNLLGFLSLITGIYYIALIPETFTKDDNFCLLYSNKISIYITPEQVLKGETVVLNNIWLYVIQIFELLDVFHFFF